MGFLVLTIITKIIGVIDIIGVFVFIAFKISDARQNSLKKKIDEIQRQYPLAYNEFISKNQISISNAKNSTLATIVKHSTSWDEDEKKLHEVEQKRQETENQYKKIKKQYPKGLKEWERKNPNSTKENIVSNRKKIKDLEKAINFDNWEREQKEFTKKCRDLVDELLPSFGCNPYEIPFRKTNEDGQSIDGKYLVWQSFAGPYCLETNLDYTDFDGIKQRTNNIKEFKKRERYYPSSVYEKIQKFIEKLCEEHTVSIYLCANNKDWSAESLNFHYKNFHYNMCDGTPFYGFPDNVEVCDPASNAWFEGNDLDYDDYPKLKNRHIIIVEMQTDNDHLKMVCKNIIKKNKDKHPLITYISLLKGYDREEMLKLINKEKQKRKEEEERKRKEKEEEEKRKAELEKYKPDKEAIINLLRNNGINCFYHFTARANLALIKQHGGLYSWWSLKQRNIKTPFLGGEGFGQQLDVKHGLQDYVRLSFCDDHPMIFKHQQNGIDLVLLKIDIEVATWKDSLFSDINATDNNHHHGGNISDLRKVNFDAVKRNYVIRDDDDFKPHQAEVMVKTFIPAKYIINLDSPLPL